MNDETTPPLLAENPTTDTKTIDASRSATNDASATGGGDSSAELFERIQRASAGAVEQHVAEAAPKRGRGQRGPDRAPRKAPARLPNGKFVPRGGLATAPAAAPGDEVPTPLLPPELPPPTPFDREAATALIEIGLGLMNDCASAIVRAVATKETGDKALAEEAGKSVVMSEKTGGAMKLGAVQCAEKYAVRMDYAPETLLFGGLIIWVGQIAMCIRTLKATGAELRAKTEGAN